MNTFTDEEFIEMCKEVIDSVHVRTEEVYNMSVLTLNTLLQVASSEFQRACARDAYCRIWEPDTKTCFCLFE